jgi:predicted 2-oxoglutarate/Fe(II)-dependent dioxygenase YbiX/alkyl hydroperoxide reductase subunit AhpC
MNKMLALGEPAPWFHGQALSGANHYAFDTAAGRWIVMLLMGSGAREVAQTALRLLQQNRELFDDRQASFFGVTIDPSDAKLGRVAQALPGIRWFLDYDYQVSKTYGAAQVNGEGVAYAPHWLLLDPMLRVRYRATLADGPGVMAELRRQLSLDGEMPTAPVLVVPEVLSPDMCRHLIGLYERHGGDESGFMHEENGITVGKIDHRHKRRADYTIKDEQLVATLKRRMATVLQPMIRRSFQFDASRIERFIVACYDGDHGGHFRAHRDNTTKGTAHRKFACTINLNADEYEGGDLCFPEFGRRTYRAGTGGAVVFSCSLLHEARPVTRGRRYAFLPFLYDADGARIREHNLPFVGPELQNYRSGLPLDDAKGRPSRSTIA